MKVSILLATQPDGLDELKLYGALAQQNGCRLWIGQSLLVESHQLLAALAGSGVSVDVGLSVAVAPLRTAYDAAVQARSLAKLMGRSVSIAYGIGTPSFARALNEFAGVSPGTFTRNYVEEVREFLAGSEGASTEVQHLQLYPLKTPPVEIGCGVLRPRMAEKAGAVADFVVTWLTPKAYLRDVLMPRLEEGAAEVDRSRPRVVAIVQCAVARDNRNPVQLSYAGFRGHLAQPHYRDMFGKAGAVLTGDLVNDVKAALNIGVFAYGSASEIAEEIASYADFGVDEIVLNAAGVATVEGHQAALEDMEQIMDRLK